MCGISGLYHFNNSKEVREDELLKMREALIHRGPDDAGLYISPDKKAGLANRRLKIIDLSSGGHMPMASKEKNFWITYNGEIYNFQELRRELEEKGYAFRSRSDTEVILHGYEEWGYSVVEKLNGMFAFAIWDENKKILFAARDHMGIKPFYYAVQNGTFYFGSEIKAILAHPVFKKEMDERGISHYLTFSCLPSPLTLFEDIKKLPPAHYLVVKNGELEEKEYWNPASPEHKKEGEGFYVNEIRRLLRDSIKSQMVSDVPFGCFLSGGIDSSTNAALMTEALGRPVETFSVGSETHEKYNEFRYSRLMAKKLGAEPHEIALTESHLEEFVTRYPFYADDPNGDQVCFPLFWLSKLTRDKGVIVIQIGEGADEIFAGYPVYLKALSLYRRFWKLLKKIPQPLKNTAFWTAEKIRNPRLDFWKEYLKMLKDKEEPFWGYAIAFSDYHKEKLLKEDFKRRLGNFSDYPFVERYYREIDAIDNEADFLKRMTYLELKHRLPEVLLMRADKMTMAHSIEGRVPFLDKRLVELALNMPTEIKIKDNKPKYILKRSVEGIIPNEIIYREKQGFAAPMSEYLKPQNKISSFLVGKIFGSSLKKRDFLNYDYVKYLIDAHQRKGVEHNFRIWNLITLSLWYDYWFK